MLEPMHNPKGALGRGDGQAINEWKTGTAEECAHLVMGFEHPCRASILSPEWLHQNPPSSGFWTFWSG
ncbi:MAG: hypothetical protein ACF8PN_10210 [Phycisphaerales bacterium]